ncbi:DUF4625 domain-containing protein [Seonamhaeicola algicola]|uniref:DUF4625 domain-containing protein n=1 Tax=Seonamhaeicola algicola TaxID=1719036 RepID=A0A5C7AWH5_9FLAO|nr:DUF4625 domain-containing protein [Seonamhaeicola algicola]TXE11929.1 DUF4625 domain-containing protein [Seonamhaeicola algicola]
MKFLVKNLFLVIIITAFFGCSDDENVDETKPTISINYTEGFPKPCIELVRGETYNFRAQVTDNVELASYSLDIHHNFDHHTHDDQEANCDLLPKKQAVNPLIYLENFTIEGGLTSYEINIAVTLPNDIDTGDYHCAYSVTDVTGWQSRTSIDIKIVE